MRFSDGYFWRHHWNSGKLECYLQPPCCGALPLVISLQRLEFGKRQILCARPLQTPSVLPRPQAIEDHGYGRIRLDALHRLQMWDRFLRTPLVREQHS